MGSGVSVHAIVYSTQRFERDFLSRANADHAHALRLLEVPLDECTAALARGAGGVSLWAHDRADAAALAVLAAGGVRVLALRSASFRQVDMEAATRLGLTVLRVPACAPHAVAEHAVALLLALDRHIRHAWSRARERRSSVDGLVASGARGRVVGVVGTGRIGGHVCRILRAFGCDVLACDPTPDAEVARLGVAYVSREALFREADAITLHCPLTPETRRMVDDAALAAMRPGVVLVNTSRGGLLDGRAVLRALEAGRLGQLAVDVYEEEGDAAFHDLSDAVLADEVLTRLLTFPNVLVTARQGYFTREAVRALAETTLANLTAFERGEPDPSNVVTLAHARLQEAAPA